ncbi:MAG: hypothetical protein ACOYBY_17745 [Dermatophilaceae bacterium]
MGMLCIGSTLAVTTQRRGQGDRAFDLTTIHVQDLDRPERITRCDVAREFRGDLPTAGEMVALDVFTSAWKSQAGNVGTETRAMGRATAIESLIFESAAAK